MLRLLCRGHIGRQPGGLMGWEFEEMNDLQRQIGLFLGGMNALYGWLCRRR